MNIMLTFTAFIHSTVHRGVCICTMNIPKISVSVYIYIPQLFYINKARHCINKLNIKFINRYRISFYQYNDIGLIHGIHTNFYSYHFNFYNLKIIIHNLKFIQLF